jgi:tetratricopeptide (TPR) repeat protein
MLLRSLLIVGCCLATSTAFADSTYVPAPLSKGNLPPILAVVPAYAPAAVIVALDDRMQMTQLRPGVLMKDLCHYRYRVSTSSAECQQFIDQSLGFYYSYVWMEAARSAENAVVRDPKCAYAWFLLSRALEKWGRGDSTKALLQAQTLMSKASHRERLLITARLHEKGIIAGTTPDARKKKACESLDELLTIYDDDEEGWFARAQVAGGNEAIPYYKALLRVNPIHPGAAHELVHFYEGYKRPALGWQYAEAYMASSPGIPHAFHMQAHLAMRIGKWEHTSDWSSRAIEMEKAYHKEMKVNPGDDHQYLHHLETLTTSLVHDGRFAEAEAARKEAEKYNQKYLLSWFRMYLGERNWAEAAKIVDTHRKTDKSMGAYLGAILYLEQGETTRAAAEVDVLQQQQQRKKNDKALESRFLEAQGRLLCQQGAGDAGLKLLERVVNKNKDDYFAHSWGHGADRMESWGIGALEAGNVERTEEAFLEALAHDAGCVRAALGMYVLCDKLGRAEEAQRYHALAQRCWNRADPKHFEALKESFVHRASRIPSHSPMTTSVGAPASGR